MSFLRELTNKLTRLIRAAHTLLLQGLRSNKFFYATTLLFIISAGWIALSNSFPLIFDENYHLGVIDIYSRQISPFIDVQPDEAKYYGDITRDPSYLYHYLMSFPYRLIGLFTDDIVAKIVILRFINIGLVALSLLYWRRVVRRLGLGQAGANVVILFFCLVPLVPYTAAHINYDNLVLLLLPLLFLSLLKLVDTKQSLAYLLLAAGIAGILGVVKFSMLPVVLIAAVAAVVILLWRYRKQIFSRLKGSLKFTSRPLLIIALVVVLVGVGLFGERYGINYISYGSHTPDCLELHSYQECSENSVWIRNYNAAKSAENLDRSELWSPYEYSTKRWIPHIFNDLFITGAFADASTEIHQFMPQQLMARSGSQLARQISAIAFVVGILAVIVVWRHFPSRAAKYILIGSFLVYAAALWITNYSSYYELGRIYATQGRYMIPFIIPVVATIVLASTIVLRRWPYVGIILLIIFMLGFFQAAGALTYIIYSQPSWQWDLGYFREWNTALREVLTPLLTR